MDKNALWKWLILLVLVVWSIAIVTPLKDKIKLGLDLRGGTSYVLEVDTSEVEGDSVKDAKARALEVIRNRIDQQGLTEPIIYPESGNNRIVVQIPGLKAEDRARTLKILQS
ncbi:MAG: protein translocase subunit SecD, partial [Lentisphaerota bacterium]